ncbi:MAG: RHS repeat protein, partial [Oscillospiraceae bacterium]|nr:RHS repeat protein [Oscillospiraceae bacterium]
MVSFKGGSNPAALAAIADQKDWTNEFTSKWDYDYAGRVLRQYNANNNYISYEYDWLGRVTKVYDAVANTLSTPYYTAYLYDDLGNVIQETVPQTATTNKVTKYKYDKLGRVILESRLHDILTGAEQYRSTSYEYDWRGNPTEVTQGGYFSTTYTYDDLGRLLSSTTDGKTTSYTYNRFGKVLTETFGGKTDTYEYDENMFRTKHIQPSGKIITYETNAIGQIAEIGATGESGTRTFEYTMTGQLLQASGGNAIGKILRKYDDRGNVIYEENTGLTKEYTYDISGKRESMIAEGSGDVQSLTYSYNRLEQLEGVGGDTSAYYQYDANGNVIIAMENGHDEYSDYNRDNSPSYSTILYLGAGASSYNINYYLDGNIKSETFFDGTTKSYTYNTRNMLSSETFSTGKVVNYSYNPSGNRASMTETENGQSTVTKYVYDELNRLTRHYMESPNGDTDRTYYSYDEDGNLILRSRETATSGTATNTFSFGTSLPSVDTFKYNGYGEMSQAIVGGVTTNYTYYADGLRRTKTTNCVTTVHMWDGDNIIADLDGNYALKTGYARA